MAGTKYTSIYSSGITGKLNSELNSNPPVKVPSPPITTRASIPALVKFLHVPFFFYLLLSFKSCRDADFNIVPPLYLQYCLPRGPISLKSPSIMSPSNL
jgi:hypothetical protein